LATLKIAYWRATAKFLVASGGPGAEKMSTAFFWKNRVFLGIINRNNMKIGTGGRSYGESEEGDAGSLFLVASGGKKISTAFF
jgi:hypothetical protein